MDEQQREYDAETFYDDSESGLGEGDRLKFAKQILFFLFLLVIFVFLSSYYFIKHNPDNTELVSVIDTVLDITKTVVPSTVTLVLGFYFGKKEA